MPQFFRDLRGYTGIETEGLLLYPKDYPDQRVNLYCLNFEKVSEKDRWIGAYQENRYLVGDINYGVQELTYSFKMSNRIYGITGVLLIIATMITGCRNTTHKEFDTALWENDIFNRIGEAPVDGGFAQDDYWVWGSSVVRGDDGKYHMYVSRWPKFLPFHPGWLVASEIVHAVSDTPEGPYEFSDVALPARGPEYWDGRSTHNPRIFRHNDTYVLIYMGSTNPFADVTNPDTLTLSSAYTTVARANKRIGIATSKSPYGPWERRDKPILDTKPGTFYSFLTSNPSPWINEDGSVIMLFKSRSYKEDYPFQTSMMIGVATAPSIDGPFKVVGDEPIFGVNKMGEVEDMFLWKDETGYNMLAKDQRGTITGNHHAGILAHSADGIHWVLDKEPLAYTREIRWSDGQTMVMGQLERVFGLTEEGRITHLFFATMDGPGGFNNSTRSWNMVLPLKD